MRNLLILVLASPFINGYSQDFLPSVIFQLDKKFNHHVLIVEKNTHTLYLYEYQENKFPVPIKTYQVATGKIIGDKEVQGDKKTPEGIYQFQNFFSSENLTGRYGKTGLIYGAGAFTLNYPNEFDRREGKTGGGIWLHSTDDDSRVNKGLDSRGCVVATDAHIKEISEYIELGNTSVIIVQDMNYLTTKAWKKKKKNILTTVDTWMKAWQEKDFESYIDTYSKVDFKSRKGNYYQYYKYKRAVFARKDSPVIKFRNMSILHHQNYTQVTMEQDYTSPIINDIGKKTLFLQQDKNYQWKIVSETFQKLSPAEVDFNFKPAQRYFSNKLTTNNFEQNYDTESI